MYYLVKLGNIKISDNYERNIRKNKKRIYKYS